jgi:hypothetical protein
VSRFKWGLVTRIDPPEFETRQQGLKGLKEAYGIEFKEFRSFDAGAQSTLVKLLTENKIQAADLFTTDPTIQENKLVVLEDPENVFSAQNVTPLIHKESVDETARAALNAISAKLTTQDLLDMMKRIVIDKDDQEKVAEDWLKKSELAVQFLDRYGNEVGARGIGVVVVSSYLPELLGICDRVIVVRENAVAGELDAKGAPK